MADQTVTSTHPLEALIDSAFDRRTEISPATVEPALLQALDRVVARAEYRTPSSRRKA